MNTSEKSISLETLPPAYRALLDKLDELIAEVKKLQEKKHNQRNATKG